MNMNIKDKYSWQQDNCEQIKNHNGQLCTQFKAITTQWKRLPYNSTIQSRSGHILHSKQRQVWRLFGKTQNVILSNLFKCRYFREKERHAHLPELNSPEISASLKELWAAFCKTNHNSEGFKTLQSKKVHRSETPETWQKLYIQKI